MKEVKLKEVAKVVIGISAPKNFIKENDSNAVPFIRAGLLEDLSNGKENYIEYLSGDNYKIIPKDTVVFAKSGMSALKNRVYCLKKDSIIVGHLAGIICNHEKLYFKYLEYYLKQKKTSKLNKNDSYPSIRTEDIENIIIHLPEIEEQKLVANKLDKVQEIIEVRKKQIEELDELIKSQFVEMFGNPILNEKQWVKKEIQELVMPDCTISYGIVQTGDEVDDGIPVFRPIDIVNNVPKLENLKKTAKEISDRYKKTILKGNELLITVRANIGDTYIIDESFKDCNVGRGITPLRFDEKYINTNFMKIQLDNDEMKYEIKKLAKGITLLQLNMEDLRKIRVIVPPIELQKDFVDKIKLIDKQKFEIRKSLEEMEKLQESLMNKYFGG